MPLSLSLTGITPSLPQSIYQHARSCQPVTGSKVVNDWLPTKVRGRGRSCQDRPPNGWGRSCACQSELCLTLGLIILLHCSKTEERTRPTYRCGQQLVSELRRSLMVCARTRAPPEQIGLASHLNMPIDLVNKSNLMPHQKGRQRDFCAASCSKAVKAAECVLQKQNII